MYTTDPRIVSDALPIHEISFDEAAELSVFGGKVLHPATLKPAIRGGVNVRVASSSNPDEPGTFIVKEAKKETGYQGNFTSKGSIPAYRE
ncbi:MAG: hypothetical protein U5K35_08160 [Rhodohalobacter sp.]|nr:hypothetical protein [Rhodohalobacter sp.]MDZ7756366.1 hypothetical protein [Rhodohalobacter sp.]